ncbi:MAG: hypothetical protein HY872_04935 [Chloroflexi bacterium]|nr:hypothetical protein [Chloroflexota bacterium]
MNNPRKRTGIHPFGQPPDIKFRDDDRDGPPKKPIGPPRQRPAAVPSKPPSPSQPSGARPVPRTPPHSMPQPPRAAAGAAGATAASGVGPSPAEVLADRIGLLQSQVGGLQSSALLSTVKDELEDVATNVNGLSSLIAGVRQAGHVYDADLEPKAATLQQGWPAVRSGALAELNRQAPALRSALRAAEDELRRLVSMQSNFGQANAMLPGVENTVQNLGDKVNAVTTSIKGTYDSFTREANSIKERVTKIQAMLQLVNAASFRLLPTEGVVAATQAKLDKDGKDDPNGYLFLTDQRLLFEQNEEVATKKVLFVTTEKQKVQKLLIEMPVAQVEKATASKKGLFGNEDHLELLFESGAAVRAAHFHLDGQDCNMWQALVGRAKANDFDKERAVKIDQAALDRVSKAPTQCPNCGSAFTQPVVRGQTEIKCEYCGTVTRL